MARGLTLIEMLAVVTLLALTVSLVTATFAGSVDSARLREAASILRNTDARARLRARATSPILLSTHNSALLLRVDVFGASGQTTGEPAPITLPDDAHLVLLSAEGTEPLESVRFDRLGRSRDYRVQIHLGEVSRTLHVAGLTGWIEEGDS